MKLHPPTNKQEVRSLIGMVSYLNKFIPNTSALLEPLRVLLKDNVHFHWGHEQEDSFVRIKDSITRPSNLVYFNNQSQTEVLCDASMKGLGACLMQEGVPVYYASKSLTSAEARYSNIEREMLGVVYALTRFHQYTYGTPIVVVADHRPLESICKKNINDCPARLQRMLLRIQKYNYTIVYRVGSKIPIPDCLSRLVPNRQDPEIPGMKVKINQVVLTHPTKLDKIREHTSCNDDMLQLRDAIINGWPPDRFSIPTALIPFWPHKDELGYHNGIIVKGDRVVVPSTLQREVLTNIHKGHLGIKKCRLKARRCVFWPNMNVDISKMINSCVNCQIHSGPQPKNYTYNMKDSCHYPLQCVGTDIFEYNNTTYLIIIDYFSCYPWIRMLKNITTKSVINALRSVFCEFGFPNQLHTDAGSQFTSSDFKKLASTYDFKHTTSSPYYHESNGKAERYVGIVKQLLRKNDNIGDSLLAYRSAPLTNNSHSPGELMFNRNINDHVINLQLQNKSDDRCEESVVKHEPYRYSPLYSGDKVFIYDVDHKIWEQGVIRHQTDQPNQYAVAFSNGRIANRNRMHLKIDSTASISNSETPNTINKQSTNNNIPVSIDDLLTNQPTNNNVPPTTPVMSTPPNTIPDINIPPTKPAVPDDNNLDNTPKTVRRSLV